MFGPLTMLAMVMATQVEAPPSPATWPLRPAETAAGSPFCSPDRRVCLALIGGGEDTDTPPQLVITEPNPQPGTELRGDGGTLDLPDLTEGRMTVDLWDSSIYMVGNPEDAEGNYSLLIGFVTSLSTAYSGGGGQARRLHIYRLRLGVGSPRLDRELLSLPLSGSLLIRACFGEEDSERRRGVCHDDYNYGATLTLDPRDDRGDEFPALVYTAQATAYPQTARRGEDSSAAVPLRASDLSRWRDPECSFTRRLRYNPASERYEMDRPAPDCSSYTVP